MDIPLQDKLQILDELSIKYDKKNIEDIDQLYQILTQKLSYPSTERAILHMEANRLGTLDIKKQGKKAKKPSNSVQAHHQEINSPTKPHLSLNACKSKIQNHEIAKKEIKSAKYCACCGLRRQTQTISICTKPQDIQHLGIATRLFFLSYIHVFVLMIVMFLVYSIFAIISNVYSCKYQSQNLKQPYRTQSYEALVQQWIFAVSLHANLLCSQEGYSITYEIQCWLGVALTVVYVFVIVILKLRKHLICASLQHSSKTIANLSILVDNLPAGITPQQLEKRLRSYQKRVAHKADFKEAKKQIKVVKINRAAPYYLSFDDYDEKQIEQAEEKYDKTKQNLAKLIKYRIKHHNFNKTLQQRIQIYKQFQNAKTQRIQAYKKISLRHVLKKKRQILTTPAFVTFESSYNKEFLLRMYDKSKKIFSKQDFFYFNLEINGEMKKIQAKIHHAPKPEQVIWTNLGQSRRSLLTKKIKYNLVNAVFLLICFAVTFGLQLYDFNYGQQNQETSLYITILVTLVIVIISYVIQYILMELTKRQRNITVMHQQKSLQQKYVTSCLANYLIAPLIFSLVYAPQFEGIAPLSETVFILSIDNAFFFPLLGVFDPIYYYNRLCKWYYNRPINKLKLNQRQLNTQSQYLQFSIGQQFAYAITSFIFTCFYSPLQPIIIVFSIIGIVWMYWTQKHILFNRCIRPVPGNRIVNLGVHKYIAMGPIAFAIGCLVWPYYITKKFVGLVPSIICIVISVCLVIFFVPFQKFIENLAAKSSYKKFLKKQLLIQEKLYSVNKGKFRYEYDRLNYLTAKEAMKDYVYENYLKEIVDFAVQNIDNKNKDHIHKDVNISQFKDGEAVNKKNIIKLTKEGQKQVEEKISELSGVNSDKDKSEVPRKKSMDITNLLRSLNIHHQLPNDGTLLKETKKSKKMGVLNIQYNMGGKKAKINMNTYIKIDKKNKSDGNNNRSSRFGSVQTLRNLRRKHSLDINLQDEMNTKFLQSIQKKKQMKDYLRLQTIPQLERSQSNYSNVSNEEEQHNYQYYYEEYNDDEQVLVFEVLQFLKQQFNIDYMPKNQRQSVIIEKSPKNEDGKKEEKKEDKNFMKKISQQHYQDAHPQVDKSQELINRKHGEGGQETQNRIHIQY